MLDSLRPFYTNLQAIASSDDSKDVSMSGDYWNIILVNEGTYNELSYDKKFIVGLAQMSFYVWVVT